MILYSEKDRLTLQDVLARELYNHLVIYNGRKDISTIVETDKYFLADLVIYIEDCNCGKPDCKYNKIKAELIDYINHNMNKKLFITPVWTNFTEEMHELHNKTVERMNNGFEVHDAGFLQSLKIS